jgi:ornithine cyclodeaminase/alanine dehydrogenase-like protein (mu-crystallin family)
MTLLLTERHLRDLLTMRDLVPLMEQALAAFSTGGVVQPVRPVVRVQEHGGGLAAMAAYVGPQAALGLKAVTFFPGNAARGLHTHMATTLLHDAKTGALLAILDGRLVTEMRTAAVTAAATRRLARQGASIVAMLGSGVQARSHVEALREVMPIGEIRVWSRTRAHADRFAGEVRERHGLPVAVHDTGEQAVRGADVICTVTASQAPVLSGAWLAPGVHVNAVGASVPPWRELDAEVVVRSRVFVDSRAAALVEAADLLEPMREGRITDGHIVAEIGEVFAGRHPGRTGPHEITLFKSLGQAAEDVAAARFAYERARDRQIGQTIALE